MRLRRPTRRELRLGLPVLVPVVVVGVFVVRGCRTAAVPHLHAPAGVAPAVTDTTVPVDLTGVALAHVDGTTTTVPARSAGTARLSGTVTGPNGPVPGAVVRVEHLVARPTSIDVVAGPDGRYNAPNIAGGRYRVRAFLAPQFAQTDPAVFFLTDGEQRTVDLQVDSFSGLAVTSAIAPDPPVRTQSTSLVVRVATRTVDTDGLVRAQPVVNASVTLLLTQDWAVHGASTAFTDGIGDAGFEIECRTAGASQLQVQVRPTPTDQPQVVPLAVTACAEPGATTTTSSGSSSSSTSASSSSSSPGPPN